MTAAADFDLDGLDAVSAEIVRQILQIAAGDLSSRTVISERGDGADAIRIALNMLAESFQIEQQARARAETLLAARLDQAERMDALGRLAGGLAHDFNNLLLVITATAEMLMRQLEDRPREREEAALVRDTATRAATFTRELLDLARHGGVPEADVAIDDAIRGDARLLSRLVGDGRSLQLACDAAGARVRLAVPQLGQLLANLLGNACDATPGGGTIRVRTRRRCIGPADLRAHPQVPPGDYVELTVEDSGHGMPEEVRARIFEPFFTTKPQGRGTGLGLSIVSGLVRLARGYVSVCSELGAGTTFCVLLPEVSVQPLSLPVAPPSPPPASLLLVEDDDTSSA